MANVKISQLSSAAALTGSEEVAIVQSNATVKTTAQAIADLAGGGGLGTLEIETVGTLGQNNSINYSIKASYSGTATGVQSLPVTATPDIYLYGSPSATVTVLSFPTLTSASNINIGNFPSLQSFSVPELLRADAFNLNFNPSLATISAAKLQTIGNGGLELGGGNPFTVNASFPALLSVYRIQCTNTYFGISAITSTVFPVLSEFGGLFQNVSDITEITLPSVNSINSYGLVVNTFYNTLTKVHLPNIISINNFQMNLLNNSALNDVQIGTVGVTKTYNGGGSSPSINFQGCNLSEASVDGILQLWASLDGTNGTTSVSGGGLFLNSGTNAAPSSTGLAAKAVLEGRGWNVSTN
jgi:hypothetical protein